MPVSNEPQAPEFDRFAYLACCKLAAHVVACASFFLEIILMTKESFLLYCLLFMTLWNAALPMQSRVPRTRPRAMRVAHAEKHSPNSTKFQPPP